MSEKFVVCEEVSTQRALVNIVVWGELDPEEARRHAYEYGLRRWGQTIDGKDRIDLYDWETANLRGGIGRWEIEDEISFLIEAPEASGGRPFWILELSND